VGGGRGRNRSWSRKVGRRPPHPFVSTGTETRRGRETAERTDATRRLPLDWCCLFAVRVLLTLHSHKASDVHEPWIDSLPHPLACSSRNGGVWGLALRPRSQTSGLDVRLDRPAGSILVAPLLPCRFRRPVASRGGPFLPALPVDRPRDRISRSATAKMPIRPPTGLPVRPPAVTSARRSTRRAARGRPERPIGVVPRPPGFAGDRARSGLIGRNERAGRPSAREGNVFVPPP
jgi:hypothetical protein